MIRTEEGEVGIIYDGTKNNIKISRVGKINNLKETQKFGKSIKSRENKIFYKPKICINNCPTQKSGFDL